MSRTPFYRPTLKPVGNVGMSKAMRLHTRLTPAKVAECMAPLRACFLALREARATHTQWLVINTHFLISQEIEKQGIVRGLQGHITAALAACQSYASRSGDESHWKPSALYFNELDAISCMLDMHQFQIEQLSAHELQTATKRMTARILTQGGQAFVAENDLSRMAPYQQTRRA